MSNKYTVSTIMFLSAMLTLQAATLMTSFSYFLPKNSQSVIAQLHKLTVKWNDNMPMAQHET